MKSLPRQNTRYKCRFSRWNASQNKALQGAKNCEEKYYSDGECTRGLGPAGSTVDPEWGIVDPAAGAWFPEMALDLVHNANPPLP